MKNVVFFTALCILTTVALAQDKSPNAEPKEAVKPAATKDEKVKPKTGEPTTAIDFLLRGNTKQDADDMKGALEDYNESRLMRSLHGLTWPEVQLNSYYKILRRLL